ncbi:MAG: hypothetical protein NTU83_12490, partial [Candidatus Hydrogenedentes bacterium]|nr:hypothetical protein [Candidatus Hydrogenedentota bacterium]
GTGPDASPFYTYQGSGVFTVSLTVTTDAGSDSEVKSDYITVQRPLPVTGLAGLFVLWVVLALIGARLHARSLEDHKTD